MNTQKRLLIFHPTIAPYRIDFFNDLNKAFRMHICLKYWNLRDQTFNYKKIYERFAFRPYYLKEWFTFRGRSFCGGYWKQLDVHSPDLVLTEEFGIGTLGVLLHRFLKRKHYKVVTLCDDSYDMVIGRNDFSWMHRWARRMVTPWLDDVIVVSPEVKDWFQRQTGKGFFFPILQEEQYARTQYRKALERTNVLQRRYGLKDRKVFLFVGRLVALKNVKTLIEAFSRLDRKKNKLVIVGDGIEMDSLQQLAKQWDVDVHFTGRLEGEALNAWYNAADVFVLPSYREAFGAVTNEALLAGCYALVSAKAGSACLVVEGENGYTFQPMDVDDLARKMQAVSLLPVWREADGLKRNQMKLSYQEYMERLVERLNDWMNG